MENKSYYSIIYISPSSLLGEKLAVGMLILNQGTLWMNYEVDKIKKIKPLLGNSYDLLNSSFKAFKRQVKKLKKEDHTLFKDMTAVLSNEYLQKLCKYHNNLVQFGEPKVISNTSKVNFDAFYNVFFPLEFVEASPTKSDNYRIYLENNFKSKLVDKVHTDIRIDDKILPNSYFNFELDALGKNGSLYLAKYVDFTNSMQSLDKTVSHLMVINRDLKQKFNIKLPNKLFAFAFEPEISTKEHRIYEYLHKSKDILLKHPEEAESVANFISESGATKFLNEEIEMTPKY